MYNNSGFVLPMFGLGKDFVTKPYIVQFCDFRFFFFYSVNQYKWQCFHVLLSFRKSNSKRINRMLSNESLHSPVFNRSISETSMDNSSMEDFWCELKNIKENSEDVLDDSLVMDVKPVDGKWLVDWHLALRILLSLCVHSYNNYVVVFTWILSKLKICSYLFFLNITVVIVSQTQTISVHTFQ